MKHWKSWWLSLSALIVKCFASIALYVLGVYRQFFSGLYGGVCRFYPTCSEYAEQAFHQHPPSFAFFLVAKRLCKCHPLGPFGYDPVPERKTV